MDWVRLQRTAGVILVAVVAACGGGEAPPPEASGEAGARTETAAAPAADEGLIPGTPEGGLEEWVADIRAGLEPIPAEAEVAPQDARQKAVELYVGRQEYIEMYYGPGGRLTAGEALGAEVEAAEDRFHDLMQLLGGTPAPSGAQVSEAVDALDAQLGRVLSEARAAGVPLTPAGSEAR